MAMLVTAFFFQILKKSPLTKSVYKILANRAKLKPTKNNLNISQTHQTKLNHLSYNQALRRGRRIVVDSALR